MAHTDKILDTDKHFEIDPITRAIKNQSPSKVSVMQYDHNSERFTFTLPKSVEGHDMTECNRIEVHYINIDSITKESNTGVYEVSDLAVSPEDENSLTCSWLLSQNATQKVGALSFLLRFACVDAEGNIEYAWNTGIFKGIHVSAGMYNSEIIVEQYADVLEQWQADIIADIKSEIEIETGTASFVVNVEVAADGTVTLDRDTYEIGDAYREGKSVLAYVVYSPDGAEGGTIISMGEETQVLNLVNVERMDATYKPRFANVERVDTGNYQATFLWYEGAKVDWGGNVTDTGWRIETVTLPSKDYVNNQIGDIETALDNIITKYGLGGDDV